MSRSVSLPETPVVKPKPEIPGCIHEMFEAQTRRTPDAIAVSFQQEHLTYAELNERANQLARHLKKLGVKPEARVALYLDRTQWMVISILAVLKAGGAGGPMGLKP